MYDGPEGIVLPTTRIFLRVRERERELNLLERGGWGEEKRAKTNCEFMQNRDGKFNPQEEKEKRKVYQVCDAV